MIFIVLSCCLPENKHFLKSSKLMLFLTTPLLTPLHFFFLLHHRVSWLRIASLASQQTLRWFPLQPHLLTFLELSCWFLLEYLKDGLVRNLKCDIFLGRQQLKYLWKNLLFRFHSNDCQCPWTTDSPSNRIFSWCNDNENHTLRSLSIQNTHSKVQVYWKPILSSSCALRQDFIKYSAVIKVWFCHTFFQRLLVIDQPNIYPVADIFHRLAAVVHGFEKIFLKLINTKKAFKKLYIFILRRFGLILIHLQSKK